MKGLFGLMRHLITSKAPASASVRHPTAEGDLQRLADAMVRHQVTSRIYRVMITVSSCAEFEELMDGTESSGRCNKPASRPLKGMRGSCHRARFKPTYGAQKKGHGCE
jgi:hypothetical protein